MKIVFNVSTPYRAMSFLAGERPCEPNVYLSRR